MSDLEELGKQIKVLQEKYDALVNKPEYPDGTPGYFGSSKMFGYLEHSEGG